MGNFCWVILDEITCRLIHRLHTNAKVMCCFADVIIKIALIRFCNRMQYEPVFTVTQNSLLQSDWVNYVLCAGLILQLACDSHTLLSECYNDQSISAINAPPCDHVSTSQIA